MKDKKLSLDLGCGRSKTPGTIGVDILPEADIQHNLNKFPYPFEDSSVCEVWLNNTLEHLDDVPKVFREIYRICEDAARVHIIVPYWNSSGAHADPTHKHFFTEKSMDYFTGQARNSLTEKLFELENVEYIYPKGKLGLLPFKRHLKFILCNVVEAIHFELDVVKWQNRE